MNRLDERSRVAQTISLSQLHAHPQNSNVMPGPLLNKLKRHIARSGHYPPIIVRPHPDEELRDQGMFQILDGHHRATALRSLGHSDARCDVWQVSDAEALLLLATLNRLEGRDDPRKRADLIAALFERSESDAAALLPERTEALAELMQLRDPPPAMKPVPSMDAIPVAVYFFLLPAQRKRLETVLAEIDDQREAALMQLIDQHARGDGMKKSCALV